MDWELLVPLVKVRGRTLGRDFLLLEFALLLQFVEMGLKLMDA